MLPGTEVSVEDLPGFCCGVLLRSRSSLCSLGCFPLGLLLFQFQFEESHWLLLIVLPVLLGIHFYFNLNSSKVCFTSSHGTQFT